MIAINNDNDRSVPDSRMGRLRAREQQKQQKKASNKHKKTPKAGGTSGSQSPTAIKPHNKNKKSNSKKWLWIVGILVVVIVAIFFIVRRTNNASAKDNAEKIVQTSFNNDRDNITNQATSAQMIELEADAKKIQDNTAANQYSQLASLGKSAISFRERVSDLKSGNNYRTSTTGDKVSSLLQDLKDTTFKSDFSGFYNEYNKLLTNLQPKAAAVSKLHKETNKLFKNGKSGSLHSSVTSSKLNDLLDSLDKYPNFEQASKDLTRVETAVKTYRKDQDSASSSAASSAASQSASMASSQSASAALASSQASSQSASTAHSQSTSAASASSQAAASSSRASNSTASSSENSSSSKNSSSQSSASSKHESSSSSSKSSSSHSN
ncbi:hypothetical protein AH70_08840 [Pediococcus damnosus LMG 28219]|uniref:hypothetical protein n=1 Tax=Pediococcus damnosus TaxID=51663 RepID=UPI00061EE8BC|nr:hypothetical protein [Pediococcus damnosus]KJU74052.1 hypothetical protein AH70_08840 [Pediococcus damnosus LMG 28219]PIO84554.1 hypothetical protein BSQ37_00720 [Pediococcus damnosus]